MDVVLVVVTVWGWEGGEGWRVEEGEEKVMTEVVEGTEKRTVESYLCCEKTAEVEGGSERPSPLLLPAKPACEFDRVLPGLYTMLESGPILLM